MGDCPSTNYKEEFLAFDYTRLQLNQNRRSKTFQNSILRMRFSLLDEFWQILLIRFPVSISNNLNLTTIWNWLSFCWKCAYCWISHECGTQAVGTVAFPDFSSDVSPSFTGPSPRGWWPLSGEPVPAVWSPVPPPHSQSTSGQLGRGRLQGSTQVRIFSCPWSHLLSSP